MSYGFYLAEVASVANTKDNRLGVRILPQMGNRTTIPDSKCPVWPSFFKDELYTGKKGDLVWVICDDEFSMGYVFGLANYNTYPDIVDNNGSSSVFEKSLDGIDLSIPSELRSAISEASISVLGVTLSLDNVKVTYWDSNCIHYIERRTGGKVIAFKSGTLYIFRQNEFVIKIGKSVLRLDAKSLSAVSDSILMQSDFVGLGNSRSMGNVLVTNGKTSTTAMVSESVHA